MSKSINIDINMFYIKNFSNDKKTLYHVALCYLTDDIPSFVYLHFPTRDKDIVEKYKRGELVYDLSLIHI